MFWELCFPGAWSSHKGLCCGIKVEDKIEEVTGDVSDELNKSDNSNDKDNNNFMGIIANK